jgi:hypothetical protein
VILSSEIAAELRVRGVRAEPLPHGGVRLIPARLIDPDLLSRILRHKTELLLILRAEHYRATADTALALLNRLRCYTLPTGRMLVVSQLAEALAAFALAVDPAAILGALRDFEQELVALGGAPDPELTETVAMVHREASPARVWSKSGTLVLHA